jgi:SAM-dependent methyltransferase
MEFERQRQHWETIAARWKNVGHPLRPCQEDVENFAELIGLPSREPIRALILGVTPELYHLAWPPGSRVHSVDQSSDMIEAIWPGPAESASNADWLDVPFPDESFDYVLCDGGLTLLDYPRSQQALSTTVARILKRGGRFITRLFAIPDEPEQPCAVIADARAGKIRNVHTLKLRLAMALQTSAQSGIVLHLVYDRIIQEFGSLDGLCAATDWPREEVFTLTSYHLSKGCYHFVTREQCIEVLSSGGSLAFERRIESRYPLGERCPLLSFGRE